MIKLRTGLPRNGKTLSIIHDLILELVWTERFIVTNISELKLGELGSYLDRKYPEAKIDLDARLRIIEKPNTMEFYRYRSGGLVLPKLSVNRYESREDFLLRFIDYFKAIEEKKEYGLPVTYFISEAHDYFDSKEWADVGRPVLMYASKHAHLHDEIIFETQHVDMLAVQFRRLVAYTEEMQNQYKMTFGPFRRPGCFKKTTFYRVPSSKSDTPVEVKTFKLDLEIAACYDTTGALGLSDRGPEKESVKSKKMPWWMLWFFGGLGAVALIAVLWTMPGLVSGYFAGILKTTERNLRGIQPTTVASGGVPEKPKFAVAAGALDDYYAKFNAESEKKFSTGKAARPMDSRREVSMGRRVVGATLLGSKVRVMWSDGSLTTERDHLLESVDSGMVRYDGVDYLLYADPAEKSDMARAPAVVAAPVSDKTEQKPYSPEVFGSWRRDSDGVNRLVERETRGR